MYELFGSGFFGSAERNRCKYLPAIFNELPNSCSVPQLFSTCFLSILVKVLWMIPIPEVDMRKAIIKTGISSSFLTPKWHFVYRKQKGQFLLAWSPRRTDQIDTKSCLIIYQIVFVSQFLEGHYLSPCQVDFDPKNPLILEIWNIRIIVGRLRHQDNSLSGISAMTDKLRHDRYVIDLAHSPTEPCRRFVGMDVKFGWYLSDLRPVCLPAAYFSL